MRGRKAGGTATGAGVIYEKRKAITLLSAVQFRCIHALIVLWKRKNRTNHPLFLRLPSNLLIFACLPSPVGAKLGIFRRRRMELAGLYLWYVVPWVELNPHLSSGQDVPSSHSSARTTRISGSNSWLNLYQYRQDHAPTHNGSPPPTLLNFYRRAWRSAIITPCGC